MIPPSPGQRFCFVHGGVLPASGPAARLGGRAGGSLERMRRTALFEDAPPLLDRLDEDVSAAERALVAAVVAEARREGLATPQLAERALRIAEQASDHAEIAEALRILDQAPSPTARAAAEAALASYTPEEMTLAERRRVVDACLVATSDELEQITEALRERVRRCDLEWARSALLEVLDGGRHDPARVRSSAAAVRRARSRSELAAALLGLVEPYRVREGLGVDTARLLAAA